MQQHQHQHSQSWPSGWWPTHLADAVNAAEDHLIKVPILEHVDMLSDAVLEHSPDLP